MEDLILSKSNLTPFVSFNSQTKILELEGGCIPENAHAFFVPIIRWIGDFFGNNMVSKEELVQLTITCDYYNSSSAKMLVYLFDKVAEIQKDGFNFKVNWIYKIDDPDLLDSIEDYVSITNAVIEVKLIED
ncbi:MAG: DUF1987 domain-containing protein [Bacteroidia bacterium]|nr:DUF1987 domain-containing protein [Bacteroidia bacterium]